MTCHLTELVTAATVSQNKSSITQGGNIRVLKTRPTDLHPSPHRPIRPVQSSADPILILPALNLTVSKLLLLLRNKMNIFFLNIFHLIQKKCRSCYCWMPIKQQSAMAVALFSRNHTTWDLEDLTVRSLWEVNASLPASSMWLILKSRVEAGRTVWMKSATPRTVTPNHTIRYFRSQQEWFTVYAQTNRLTGCRNCICSRYNQTRSFKLKNLMRSLILTECTWVCLFSPISLHHSLVPSLD